MLITQLLETYNMTTETNEMYIDTDSFDIFSQLDDIVSEVKEVEEEMGDFIDESINGETPEDIDDLDTSFLDDIEEEEEFNYEDIDDEVEDTEEEDEMEGLDGDEELPEEEVQPLNLDSVQSETQVMFNGELTTIGDVIARAKTVPEEKYKELQELNGQSKAFYEASVRANVMAAVETEEMMKAAQNRLQYAINSGNGMEARSAQQELVQLQQRQALLEQRTDEVMNITNHMKTMKINSFKKEAQSVFGSNSENVIQSTGVWLEQECGVDSMALLEHGNVKLLSKLRKLMAMENQQQHQSKVKKGATSLKGKGVKQVSSDSKTKASKKAANGDWENSDVFNALED